MGVNTLQVFAYSLAAVLSVDTTLDHELISQAAIKFSIPPHIVTNHSEIQSTLLVNGKAPGRNGIPYLEPTRKDHCETGAPDQCHYSSSELPFPKYLSQSNSNDYPIQDKTTPPIPS